MRPAAVAGRSQCRRATPQSSGPNPNLRTTLSVASEDGKVRWHRLDGDDLGLRETVSEEPRRQTHMCASVDDPTRSEREGQLIFSVQEYFFEYGEVDGAGAEIDGTAGCG